MMLTRSEYAVAVVELIALMMKKPEHSSPDGVRLKKLVEAIGAYQAAHSRGSRSVRGDCLHRRRGLDGIDVLPLARARRDLNSILRRQRRVIVTR